MRIYLHSFEVNGLVYVERGVVATQVAWYRPFYDAYPRSDRAINRCSDLDPHLYILRQVLLVEHRLFLQHIILCMVSFFTTILDMGQYLEESWNVNEKIIR